MTFHNSHCCSIGECCTLWAQNAGHDCPAKTRKATMLRASQDKSRLDPSFPLFQIKGTCVWEGGAETGVVLPRGWGASSTDEMTALHELADI